MNDSPEQLPAPAARMEALTFGEPTPVLDDRGILDYLEFWSNGRWYDTPLSFDALAKSPGQRFPAVKPLHSPPAAVAPDLRTIRPGLAVARQRLSATLFRRKAPDGTAYQAVPCL
jgi:hypothetical protein